MAKHLFPLFAGLYMVKKAWFTTGSGGFMVWKFALKRC